MDILVVTEKNQSSCHRHFLSLKCTENAFVNHTVKKSYRSPELLPGRSGQFPAVREGRIKGGRKKRN